MSQFYACMRAFLHKNGVRYKVLNRQCCANLARRILTSAKEYLITVILYEMKGKLVLKNVYLLLYGDHFLRSF